MTKETKATLDEKIYTDVKGGMTKTAAAKKYGTSARSVGRAIERHLASAAPTKESTPKKAKTKAKTKAKDETQAQYYEMKEGEPVAVSPVTVLNIGDTVVVSRDSSYEEHRSNPRGVLGVVTGDASTGSWAEVNWSDGCHNAYPDGGCTDLLLVAEVDRQAAEEDNSLGRGDGEIDYPMVSGDTIIAKAPADTIPVGTCVVLNSGSYYADVEGQRTGNPVGIFGTLQSIRESDGWVSVKWGDGSSEEYPQGGIKDLLVVISVEEFEEETATSGDEKVEVLGALKSGTVVDYIITPRRVVLSYMLNSLVVEENHPKFSDVRIAVASGDFISAFEMIS